MKSYLKLVDPTIENRAVGPTRRANSEYRNREHLTPSEVEQLIEAAKTNRYGHRDATMLLVAFRHGLRASELVQLGVVTGRLCWRDLACAPGQERQTCHAPDPRRRNARIAQAPARSPQVAVRVCQRARDFWKD